MCGIAGLYARGRRPASLERIVADQCATLVHRGPDDRGIVVDGDLGMGMRRLSIVDVEGGHQPFHSADGRYSLVFNGEIYNFRALRAECAPDRAFASQGDAEVILAGYERWGDGIWPRLDGMFAVAVWDRAERRLTLARDPVGIKPLFFTDQPGGFAFGSELKALTALPGFTFSTDERALLDFFRFGHVRGPRSIHREVGVLPPGHLLRVGATGEPRIEPYWTARYVAAPEPASDAEWIHRFRATWLDTVAAQMVADVEVGAFLSGGIDSSAVVAAMTRVSDRPVRTFTIGFPDPRYDESPHAEVVATALGTRHTTRQLDLAQAQDLLPAVAACYDEPFADPSMLPTWYVSKVAAEEVRVALSGDGGDELFFGYKRHATEDRVGRLPAFVRHAARGIHAIPTFPSRRANEAVQRWTKTAASAGLPSGIARFFAKTQITAAPFRHRVFCPDFVARAGGGRGEIARLSAEYFPDARGISSSTLEQFGLADLVLNLPGAMLTKVDRASMAHSLEVRVPMLGQRIVDLALSMPQAMKLAGRTGKHVVREAIGPWLPPGIFDRRKQGFQMPLSAWFAGDFGGYAETLWRESGARTDGMFRAREVDRVFADHRAGRRDHSRFLYALAVYSLWRAARPTPAS